MIPIINKPILEYNIEKMRNIGIDTIFVVVGHKKEVIQEYFGDGKEFGVKIKYVINKDPKGTGIADSIYLTKRYIDEPFIVVLGDDFTVINSFECFVKKFFKEKALVVEGIVYEEDMNNLMRTNCISLGENNRILKIIEKPNKPKFRLRGIGIYIFDIVVFDFIKKMPKCLYGPGRDITVTIQLMAQEGGAYGVFIDGINFNINTLGDLTKAMNYVLRFKLKNKKDNKNNI